MADRADNFVSELFAVLSSEPTAQHLDYLVEGFTKVGYLAAQAEALAEEAEAERKYQEATAYAQARGIAASSGDRVTETALANMVYLTTYDYRKKEIKAREKAQKMKNLLASCEQAINAIKFLGRYDSPVQPVINGPRR